VLPSNVQASSVRVACIAPLSPPQETSNAVTARKGATARVRLVTG
jgi:hypothetical protein